MQLLVKGKNVEVSDKLQDYAEKRLAKVSEYLDDDVTRLELEIIEERNPRVSNAHIAEATIWTKGPTLRARIESHDVYASIDMVADKLLRQVRKYKEKRVQLAHGSVNRNGRYKSALAENGSGLIPTPGSETETSNMGEATMADSDTVRIVKTKQFRLGPMTPEEAAMQMDLVGHDFFVFVNSENNQTCVLYKRNDGNYGLIEPALAEAETI